MINNTRQLRVWWLDDLVSLGASEYDINIQWFAAEDEGRTEDPTEQKIKKSREEGKVAKSAEFTSALVLLFPIITIGILSPYMLNEMSEMMQYFLTISVESTVTGEAGLVRVFFIYFAKLVAPVAIVAFAAAFISNVLQVGFLFVDDVANGFSEFAGKSRVFQNDKTWL
ncbi:MAG: EscU/YscU/HrcU family type III secretion system export apparatus switch protein [Spirochaetales bacterium]|nr:EscU/YscU/HrcU family type III secretion system export apparatus switch protein [Spirochaetales bacterium]